MNKYKCDYCGNVCVKFCDFLLWSGILFNNNFMWE